MYVASESSTFRSTASLRPSLAYRLSRRAAIASQPCRASGTECPADFARARAERISLAVLLRSRTAPTRSGTASVLTAESRWKTTSTARLLNEAKSTDSPRDSAAATALTSTWDLPVPGGPVTTVSAVSRAPVIARSWERLEGMIVGWGRGGGGAGRCGVAHQARQRCRGHQLLGDASPPSPQGREASCAVCCARSLANNIAA